MHRETPVGTSGRAYSGGGARSCVHSVDDGHFMQEMGGGFMNGEQRSGIESPQNYGFTSVVMDADKDSNGQITGCAEAFISFCGGNRSFPVAGVMDDRRHRLMGMEKGDSAMYRTRDDKQQFHLTKDGGFWTAPRDKTVRMHLLDEDSGSSGSARDGTGGGGAQQKGQKPRYKDAKDSYRFVDVTSGKTRVSGVEAHMMLQDGNSYVHCVSQKTYLGSRADNGEFDKVVTLKGPAKNVYGLVTGGSGLTTSGVTAEPAPPPGSRFAPALAASIALALGVSLGMNYELLTARAATPMLASTCQFASR